jgi:hypothetical protein
MPRALLSSGSPIAVANSRADTPVAPSIKVRAPTPKQLGCGGLIGSDALHQGCLAGGIRLVDRHAFVEKRRQFGDPARRGSGTQPCGAGGWARRDGEPHSSACSDPVDV